LGITDHEIYRRGVADVQRDYDDFLKRCHEEDRQFIKNRLLAANRRGLSKDVKDRMLGKGHDTPQTKGDVSPDINPGVISTDMSRFEAARARHKAAKRKGKDDLVEEEYQGNAGYITLSERAKRFHNISDPDWNALTEKEKLGYIFKLPPGKLQSERRDK
jgi:hypothetical protein